MTYNFDTPFSRTGSDDLKHEVLQERYGRADLLPLWVADMDWPTPLFITQALRDRLDHSLYGYTILPKGYWETVAAWTRQHHGWDTPTEWYTFIPGIVTGIAMAVQVFTKPGDKVIIQPPVYYPFRLVAQGNDREVINNPLVQNADGSYRMDFDQLESVIDERCKLLVLCNPHNPAGIVWDKATLEQLAEICDRHGIIVISDEIHADMALFGHRHLPFATVSEAAARCSITFGAPSKTFNIAGIVSSWAIVPNVELRRPFYHWLSANGHNHPHIFAPIATLAALQQGEEWRLQMLAYVEDNIRFVEDFLSTHLPQIRPLRPQASFLVWLDCKALGLDQKALVDLFVNRAGLALNDGSTFGPGGEGFMRLNVGTQRAVLQQALEQLREAVATHKLP